MKNAHLLMSFQRELRRARVTVSLEPAFKQGWLVQSILFCDRPEHSCVSCSVLNRALYRQPGRSNDFA